jgi:hypothetical protein
VDQDDSGQLLEGQVITDPNKAFSDAPRRILNEPSLQAGAQTGPFTQTCMDFVRLDDLRGNDERRVHSFATGLVVHKNAHSNETLQLE